jgi:transcriptional regulator GlxA family with amidase domain
VRLTDGRSATHAVDSHRGDFNQPFPDTEIRAKFHVLAGEVLTQAGVAWLEQAVMALEGLPDIHTLVTTMAEHQAP